MKIGIFILCHHKPWLIRSSLLSLFTQNSKIKYDLHFVLIKGNGENKNYKQYEEYFKVKQDRGEKNNQLSNFDKNILFELKKIKIKYKIHNFKNDHGLDSGAWLKLIKTKIWKDYDYSFFLMEGFLFSNNKVLNSTYEFLKINKPDFISSAHEKRFLKFTRNNLIINTLDTFHQKSIKKIWLELLKIKRFKKIYFKKPNFLVRDGKKIRDITEHHVSSYLLTSFQKIKLIIKSLFFQKYLYKRHQSVLATTNKKIFLNIQTVSKKIKNINGVQFHEENSPFFFGCSCQHVFSKKILNDMNIFFKKNNIYNISKMPYFGEVFEVIWGSLPKVLFKKKWYFNGIHRVRKNLINYQREDDINGMIKYLNFYNLGKIKFYLKNKSISFKILNSKLSISSFIK